MKKIYDSPIMRISGCFSAVTMLTGSDQNSTEAGWGNGKPGEQGGIGSGETIPGGTLSKRRNMFYDEEY